MTGDVVARNREVHVTYNEKVSCRLQNLGRSMKGFNKLVQVVFVRNVRSRRNKTKQQPKTRRGKLQAGNEWSNIPPKSSQARKKSALHISDIISMDS